MNTSTITQDLELWEAWIEFDHLHSSSFGMLYILGEAPVNARKKTTMEKTVDPSDPGRLVLTIPHRQLQGKLRMKEVIFAEPVSRIGQYHSIVIYKGDDFLVEINDIEVLI
jgi:hypothetical protein